MKFSDHELPKTRSIPSFAWEDRLLASLTFSDPNLVIKQWYVSAYREEKLIHILYSDIDCIANKTKNFLIEKK